MSLIKPLHIAFGVVLLGSLCLSKPAFGQTVYPGVERRSDVPYRPKLSPYLDLLRTDNSVLSPYHSFVLPRRAVQQRQMMQTSELRRLQYQGMQGRQSYGAGNSSRLPTGHGGRFQTYLHFYPLKSRP